MKNLNYQSLLSIAIAEGATSPNPGIDGVLVWSTNLLKIMRWNSTNWESLVTKSELDGKLGNASPQTLTVNSTSPALKISQLGTGDAFVVEDSSGDTNPFVINDTGNVIIGHTTSAVLGVTADNSGADLKYIFNIAGVTQATAGMTLSMWGNPTVNSLGVQIIGAKSRTEAGVGNHGAVIDGDRLLTLIGEGSDGTKFMRSGAIKIEVDGTVSTDTVPGKITFFTTPAAGGAPIQALQIKSDNTLIHHWVSLGTANASAVPWFTSCPGKPTFTPIVPYTDAIGLRFDSTNKKLWGYFGTEWLNLSFTTEALDLPPRVLALENGKQTTLVSGTNIKTINEKIILGSGDLAIFGSRVFTFGGTGVPTVGDDKTNWLATHTYTKALKLRLFAKTAPSGGSFTVVIKAGDGTTFPTTVGTVSLGSGVKINSATISTEMAEGTLLRLDITAVNGVADWTCQLETIEAVM